MYSLDVNFLKDRHLDTSTKTPTANQSRGPALQQQLPIIIGGAVMVVLPLLTATSLLVLNQLSSQTEENIQRLDGELGQLNAQTKSFEEIEAKIQQNEQEIQALVTVFNQIRPWSAILTEIEDQIPPNVHIGSIAQNEETVTIEGYALDYDDLNDFLLTLQSSPLFKADQTIITQASLADLPIEVENVPEDLVIEIPQGVQYTITTQMTDRPSSELIQEFSRDGAVGLINRIRILESKGVLKP